MTKTNRDDAFFRENPWEGIDSGSYPKEARRLYKEDPRFWVSVDNEGRYLFYVNEIGHFAFEPSNDLECLEIEIEYFNDQTRLACFLTANEMLDKFQTIAKDIASYSSEKTGFKLFKTVIARIHSWKDFLKPSKTGLGFRELIGFWGELHVFYNYFVKYSGIENALKSWIGPENKKQDFTLGNIAIELKTTVVSDANELKISSIEQLQIVTNHLYLAKVIINRCDVQNGKSIDDLVEQCLSIIKEEGSERQKFDFLNKISSKYSKIDEFEKASRFTPIDIEVYNVTAAFPRIVPENLPHEKILKAKYVIDGNSLENFLANESLKEIVQYGSSSAIQM